MKWPSDERCSVTLHRKIRMLENESVAVKVTHAHFGNQLNASYRTAYVCHVFWAWNSLPTNRALSLCDTTQKHQVVRKWVSDCESHPCTFFGISSMPAIEQHMPRVLSMKWPSDKRRSVTPLRQILVSAYVSAAVSIRMSRISTFFELTKYNWRNSISIELELKPYISDFYINFWPIAATFIVSVVIKECEIWTKEGFLWTYYWYMLLAWFLSVTDTFP